MVEKSEIKFPLFRAVHPGEIINEELKERKIKQKDFAQAIGMQPSHLNEILKSKRALTSSVADKIEKELGIASVELMNIQNQYDYDTRKLKEKEIAEQTAINELMEYDKVVCVKTLAKRVGITFDWRSAGVATLCGLKDALQLPPLAHLQVQTARGLFSKSEKTGTNTRMLLTWTILAHSAMRELEPTGEFNPANEIELLSKLRKIFNENKDTIPRLTTTFSNYGIAFKKVEKVEKASVDGYSFIDEGKPCIVVTMRYNRIDNLAFSVIHELCHLLKHHEQGDNYSHMNIEDYDKNNTEEREANEYAANALIPKEIWNTAPAVKMNPAMVQRKFTKWAHEVGLNPWIVLGRISHDFGLHSFSDKGVTRHVN